VLLIVGLLLARYQVLTVMVWAIAALTTYTVVQRILHVHRRLAGGRRGAAA
jgi:phosphatidylglycerophosphate synthase